jgi:hypothetical protein
VYKYATESQCKLIKLIFRTFWKLKETSCEVYITHLCSTAVIEVYKKRLLKRKQGFNGHIYISIRSYLMTKMPEGPWNLIYLHIEYIY